MNSYLTKKIWEMRKNIKTLPGSPVVALIHIATKVYQLVFLSCGCENACTFCNYGFDYNLTLELVKPELEKINLDDYDIEELDLEANGSFLSEREIPYDLFLEVLHFVANSNIPTIAIETHYKTITEEKIKDIRNILGKNREILFELGFESADEDIRAIYNKDINIDQYLEVAKLCESYNIGLIINVLLGAPFLSREEQIQDCLNSLDFIYENFPKGTHVVLFPINIKENTMLKHWQDIGVYDEISSWEFVELLYRVPYRYLEMITIAWWGKRENAFTKGISQFPKTCQKCQKRLLEFYDDFYCNRDAGYRKNLLKSIWETRCECDQ